MLTLGFNLRRLCATLSWRPRLQTSSSTTPMCAHYILRASSTPSVAFLQHSCAASEAVRGIAEGAAETGVTAVIAVIATASTRAAARRIARRTAAFGAASDGEKLT